MVHSPQHGGLLYFHKIKCIIVYNYVHIGQTSNGGWLYKTLSFSPEHFQNIYRAIGRYTWLKSKGVRSHANIVQNNLTRN